MTEGSGLKYWIIWIASSLALVGLFGFILFSADDKTVFMPGPLSPGHHQLAGACESCHTEGMGGGKVLHDACINCHGDDRKKPFDSHPISKFTDPRNADRLEKINATECVSCHVEHKSEITLKDGLTQPLDVCFHCHADIGDERPSHKEMEFTSCKNSGCHNFHNNRALYTDFLVKHMDAPDITDNPRVPEKEFSSVLEEIVEYPRDTYPIMELDAGAIDAPAVITVDEDIKRDWLETSHARAGVNCSACHQPLDDNGVKTAWIDKPGLEGCSSCHASEVDRFKLGKHGMRLAAGLAPMTAGEALLPMKKSAKHESLTCASCHGAHRFDVNHAAVEGCLGCHADEHSLAYKDSPHHALWQAELTGTGKPGSGVSCATCHMPRIDFDVNDWLSRKLVDHNQSANFSPNSKMIRSACQHCHGLGFSIDALADEKLIRSNFSGQPLIHIQSIDLARRDYERYLQEKEAAGQ